MLGSSAASWAPHPYQPFPFLPPALSGVRGGWKWCDAGMGSDVGARYGRGSAKNAADKGIWCVLRGFGVSKVCACACNVR